MTLLPRSTPDTWRLEIGRLVNTIEKDRLFLESGIGELSAYLLSNELYWPVSARGADLPRLTIGGLLLSRARLRALSTSAPERAALSKLERPLEAVRSKWRSAWERKAGREVRARFDLWMNYLQDYRQDPGQHADSYPQEVRWRVMLHFLLNELAAPPAEAAPLAELDAFLRRVLIPGRFIWEAALEVGFPRDEYWFLYGSLKS